MLAEVDRSLSYEGDTELQVICLQSSALWSHHMSQVAYSYPVDKGHINGLVSPQQILLVVYAHYIAIPVGQAYQRPIEGQSGQDTYFRQYRSATRTASIVVSSQLGASHPSCLISSCLARGTR